MRCAGAQLLWKGTCDNPDDQPDSWLVHPVNDAEPALIHHIETNEDDLQNAAVHSISTSTEDVQESTSRPTDPPYLQSFTVHQEIKPASDHHSSDVGPMYKLMITPGGKGVLSKFSLKGKSIKRKNPREEKLISSIKGVLAPYIVGHRPLLAPDTPIFRIESHPVNNIDTSLFTLLGLPYHRD